MSEYVTVEGMPELAAALNAVGYTRARRLLLKALVEGAKPIRASIRAATPVGEVARPTQYDVPGNLRASVKYKASRTARTGKIAYMIGPFGKGSAHRHLVAFGHVITSHSGATGGRTRANDFVQRGREMAEGPAFAGIESAAKVLFVELTLP